MSNEKTIMIIEDNMPVRKLFSTLLKRSGFETFDFENAKKSIDWAKENTPVLIIMDILLPDMHGTELIKALKDLPNLKDTKFIAVTGFATGNDRDKFLQAGFDSYISKPVNTATFADEVKNVLNS